MDRRITWFQPEQLGRATDLWTKIINEARDGLKQLQVQVSDNNMSAKPNVNRDQDFIPLSSEYQPNGNIYDEKPLNGGISKRKENIASTYDWNSSGKLKSGGTPWKIPGTYYEEGVVGLHQEIQEFYKFMFPRPEEHVMRQEVVARVAVIINSIWPKAKVEIYGSCKTQLYLPTSDIDLVVYGDLGENPCCQLGDELQSSDLPEAGTIKVLDKASVPIVKLTDQQTGVRVDISFNATTQCTAGCAKLIEDFIIQFPNLPYLVFVLKQFLLQRDLNEVWTGGISSYSLILMIVSFLQLRVPPEPTNLGVLLIEFFELYGVLFNYFKTGISVDGGGFYFAKDDAPSIMDSHGFSLLAIMDPLSPGMYLGRNSYGFMEVRKAFGYAYRVLSRAVLPALDQENSGHSILGRIIRVTDEVVDHRRWVLQTWTQKAQTIYHYPFPVYCNLAQEDTALRIPMPGCPTEAPAGHHIPAPEDSCHENSNGSAMEPSAADREPPSDGLEEPTTIKVSSISSSSSGEIPSSSSDSESEMSSQTSGSSMKDVVDTTVTESMETSSIALEQQPCIHKTLKDDQQTNVPPPHTWTADQPKVVCETSRTETWTDTSRESRLICDPSQTQIWTDSSIKPQAICDTNPAQIWTDLALKSKAIRDASSTQIQTDPCLRSRAMGDITPMQTVPSRKPTASGDASPAMSPLRQSSAGEARLTTKPQKPLVISGVSSPVRTYKHSPSQDSSPIKGCSTLSPAASPLRAGTVPGTPQRQPRSPITPHIEVTVSSNNKSELPAHLPRSPKPNQQRVSSSSSPVSHQPVKSKTFTNSSFHSSSNNVGNLTIGGSGGNQCSSSGSSGGDNNNNNGISGTHSTINKRMTKKQKKNKRGAKN